jgi:uncharacterized membrane protein
MSSALASSRSTLFVLLAIALVTALVMLKVELPLLLGMNPEWERKIDAYRWPLHVHAFFGSIALFCAPVQFLARLRNKHLSLHRTLGRTYALSVLISAPIGIYIALAHLSNSEKWAAATLGLLWLGTTMAAVHTAMHRQIAMHRIWVARSYALTLTFVLSRFLVDVLKIEVSASIGGNGALVWVCTALAIVIAEWLSDGHFAVFPRARPAGAV